MSWIRKSQSKGQTLLIFQRRWALPTASGKQEMHRKCIYFCCRGQWQWNCVTREGSIYDVLTKGREGVFSKVQSSPRWFWPGLVNFVPAVGYYFCLSLAAAFLQPSWSLLVDPSCSAADHSSNYSQCQMRVARNLCQKHEMPLKRWGIPTFRGAFVFLTKAPTCSVI